MIINFTRDKRSRDLLAECFMNNKNEKLCIEGSPHPTRVAGNTSTRKNKTLTGVKNILETTILCRCIAFIIYNIIII